MTNTDLVQVQRRQALTILRLNRPLALNALNLELIEVLTKALQQAFDDPEVRSIWLESAVEKAFCAGGDVKALVSALAHLNAEEQRRLGHRYFAAEYRLDAMIEHSPKPIVALGRGLVMGGGWGLFAGANVRLVDASSRFSMPELQIGLFPDVGAGHFLQKHHWRAGTLIGISGIHLTHDDVLALDYAHAQVGAEDVALLQAELASGKLPAELTLSPADARILEHRDAWLSALESLGEPVLSDWIAQVQASDFEPFKAAAVQWQTASSLSIAHTWHHFKRLREASRLTALQTDLVVASNLCSEPEFTEGVRALLIDKDKQPKWLYPAVENVPFNLIERFYQPLPFETARIEAPVQD
ncbi:enoyl-CoA hydratase/isomerase family protein [Saccharospirillum mangrovi]|uniref:enoyl-CoA hydratase/isomerase family protein n=1 Tax=Saccharospirillum mangrovi TaxID=2161747 RepID=UPI000D37A676|nr:enoyl-CoA hydratase/isomerase family protein [Saccharospirillum mangrovi]